MKVADLKTFNIKCKTILIRDIRIFPIKPAVHTWKSRGGNFLAESRKILISLPEQLLKEVDSIVSIEQTNRSEFVRRTIQLYIRERRKIEIRDRLKKGYQEMAEINIRLSEIWFEADNDLQKKYEERLGELE